MRVCLFEDARAADLEPLALSRPVFDLICGRTSLGRKQTRLFPGHAVGVLMRSHLSDVFRSRHPETPVNELDWLQCGPVALVNGRWLPPSDPLPLPTREPHVALCQGQLAYAVVHPEQARGCELHEFDGWLEEVKEMLPSCDVAGRMVDFPWDLVEQNAEQLRLDYEALPHERAGWRPADCSLIGPANQLLIDSTAEVEPHVVIDTRGGPVVIDRGAVVHAFSRLEGPCYVGPHTHVHAAQIRSGTTLGPHCRIGGEVECSIVHGYTNKYHDGFLGHSYLGEWINFGAGTHTSDLRVDYGEVTVWINGRRVRSGTRKVGSFVGDHTKTGLSVLLNTGTTAGVFTTLLPGAELLPRRVPSFARVADGRIIDDADADALFSTAEIVMSRRGETFNSSHAEMFRYLFEESALTRRQAIREAEQRLLRQTA